MIGCLHSSKITYCLITLITSSVFSQLRNARRNFFVGGHSYYGEALTNLRVLSPSLQTGDGAGLAIINEINGRSAGLGVYKQTRTNLLSDARCANLVRTGSPKCGDKTHDE